MDANFPATVSEARAFIEEQVLVSPQKVAIAKAMILAAVRISAEDSKPLIEKVASKHAAPAPSNLALRKNLDSTADLLAIANQLSWRVAAAEAIIGLIHSGCLLSMPRQRDHLTFQYSCSVAGSNNQVLEFAEFAIAFPAAVILAPSLKGTKDQILADPDLYLLTLNIEGMHPEIELALRESVKCFKHDLLLGAVALLGKASEGAWLELGRSLLKFIPSDSETQVKNQRRILHEPREGAAKKIDAVATIFKRQEVCKPIEASTGIRVHEFDDVLEWSEVLRDSRNSIHFDATPKTPNNYEKVAVIFLNAVPNFQLLYRIRNEAERLSSG